MMMLLTVMKIIMRESLALGLSRFFIVTFRDGDTHITPHGRRERDEWNWVVVCYYNYFRGGQEGSSGTNISIIYQRVVKWDLMKRDRIRMFKKSFSRFGRGREIWYSDEVCCGDDPDSSPHGFEMMLLMVHLLFLSFSKIPYECNVLEMIVMKLMLVVMFQLSVMWVGMNQEVDVCCWCHKWWWSFLF